jgi:hypothetical protein
MTIKQKENNKNQQRNHQPNYWRVNRIKRQALEFKKLQKSITWIRNPQTGVFEEVHQKNPIRNSLLEPSNNMTKEDRVENSQQRMENNLEKQGTFQRNQAETRGAKGFDNKNDVKKPQVSQLFPKILQPESKLSPEMAFSKVEKGEEQKKKDTAKEFKTHPQSYTQVKEKKQEDLVKQEEEQVTVVSKVEKRMLLEMEERLRRRQLKAENLVSAVKKKNDNTKKWLFRQKERRSFLVGGNYNSRSGAQQRFAFRAAKGYKVQEAKRAFVKTRRTVQKEGKKKLSPIELFIKARRRYETQKARKRQIIEIKMKGKREAQRKVQRKQKKRLKTFIKSGVVKRKSAKVVLVKHVLSRQPRKEPKPAKKVKRILKRLVRKWLPSRTKKAIEKRDRTSLIRAQKVLVRHGFFRRPGAVSKTKVVRSLRNSLSEHQVTYKKIVKQEHRIERKRRRYLFSPLSLSVINRTRRIKRINKETIKKLKLGYRKFFNKLLYLTLKQKNLRDQFKFIGFIIEVLPNYYFNERKRELERCYLKPLWLSVLVPSSLSSKSKGYEDFLFRVMDTNVILRKALSLFSRAKYKKYCATALSKKSPVNLNLFRLLLYLKSNIRYLRKGKEYLNHINSKYFRTLQLSHL